MTTIHAAHVDRQGNIDTGRYDINVGRNDHGSFAEVRDRQGKLVERIYDGDCERLPDGTKVRFDTGRRGEVITVTKRGHTDEFNRPSKNAEWDRDHIGDGRHTGGNCRSECDDGDRGRIERRGGRSYGYDRSDRNDRNDWDGDHIRGGRSRGSDRNDCNCNDGDRGFKVDENNNTVDTGRYLITASAKDEGELKVYDKYTGQWVRAWGDPHFETGDGDTGDFNDTITLNLDDGTKLTIETTGGPNAHLERVLITKGDDKKGDDHAVEIRYEKDHKPDTDELHGREARNADRDTPDGLNLYTVHGDLDDLRAGRRGEELRGHIDFDSLAQEQQRKCAEYRR